MNKKNDLLHIRDVSCDYFAWFICFGAGIFFFHLEKFEIKIRFLGHLCFIETNDYNLDI